MFNAVFILAGWFCCRDDSLAVRNKALHGEIAGGYLFALIRQRLSKPVFKGTAEDNGLPWARRSQLARSPMPGRVPISNSKAAVFSIRMFNFLEQTGAAMPVL